MDTPNAAVVEVTEEHGQIHARVRDDGEGFDPNDDTEGFGLLGMSERVELLDGKLTIESAPGEGTTISVTLPGASPRRSGPRPRADRAAQQLSEGPQESERRRRRAPATSRSGRLASIRPQR